VASGKLGESADHRGHEAIHASVFQQGSTRLKPDSSSKQESDLATLLQGTTDQAKIQEIVDKWEQSRVDHEIEAFRKESKIFEDKIFLLVTPPNTDLETKIIHMVLKLSEKSRLHYMPTSGVKNPELRYFSKHGIPSVYGIAAETAKAKLSTKFTEDDELAPADEELFSWMKIQVHDGCYANGENQMCR